MPSSSADTAPENCREGVRTGDFTVVFAPLPAVTPLPAGEALVFFLEDFTAALAGFREAFTALGAFFFAFLDFAADFDFVAIVGSATYSV
jgi:hypothetical protein